MSDIKLVRQEKVLKLVKEMADSINKVEKGNIDAYHKNREAGKLRFLTTLMSGHSTVQECIIVETYAAKLLQNHQETGIKVRDMLKKLREYCAF